MKPKATEEVYNFKNVIDHSNKSLTESSVHRMLQWLIDCDCALMSSLRDELKEAREDEKRQKNKLMEAELLLLGYGIIKVKGVNPEELTDETSEESQLVVNRNNDENFLNNLLRISEYYNQDTIYYKEKGKTEGKLIRTNKSGSSEYHQKGEDGEIKTDTASESLAFWRKMAEGRMLIAEDIHPLTRKTMGEALRKYKKQIKEKR